jgi:aminomethyltransferase
MTLPRSLYHLALRDLHAAAGATFVECDGWSLPAHYGHPTAEHAALRASAVVFDRSHRSRFLVTGSDASELLAKVFEGHIRELEEGRAMRSVALAPDGTITDLVLITRTGGIAYLVTGQPGRRMDTLNRLREARPEDFDVQVADRTETTCLLGLAGPAAQAVAAEHLSDGLPARLQTLHSVTFEFHGFRSLATRTSDTGEDGFEFMLAPAVAHHVIETLVAAGVPLAGDDALNAARVESCIPAFAPDLETGLSPAEADLDVLLGIPGGNSNRILSALLIDSDEAIATGTPLLRGGEPAGEVRSCVHSPLLASTVALAIVDARQALPGAVFEAGGYPATIVAKPFYRRRTTQ